MMLIFTKMNTADKVKRNTFSNTFPTLLKKGANFFCTQS